LLSQSPPVAHGRFGSVPAAASASPGWGGRRGLDAAEASPGRARDCGNIPLPRGGLDAPSCTTPAASLQPGAAVHQPDGASLPAPSVAKHHPEAPIPPSWARGASQRCFARQRDPTERSHPVLADPWLDRRRSANGSHEPARRWLRPRRYFGAGISSERPSGVPTREGAAAPLFSSAAIVRQPHCSAPSCQGERRGAVSGGGAARKRCRRGAGSLGDKRVGPTGCTPQVRPSERSWWLLAACGGLREKSWWVPTLGAMGVAAKVR